MFVCRKCAISLLCTSTIICWCEICSVNWQWRVLTICSCGVHIKTVISPCRCPWNINIMWRISVLKGTSTTVLKVRLSSDALGWILSIHKSISSNINQPWRAHFLNTLWKWINTAMIFAAVELWIIIIFYLHNKTEDKFSVWITAIYIPFQKQGRSCSVLCLGYCSKKVWLNEK